MGGGVSLDNLNPDFYSKSTDGCIFFIGAVFEDQNFEYSMQISIRELVNVQGQEVWQKLKPFLIEMHIVKFFSSIENELHDIVDICWVDGLSHEFAQLFDRFFVVIFDEVFHVEMGDSD